MGDFAIAIDTLHENEVEEIIIDVTQIIKESAQWHPECCIYKVPKRLRKVMEQAYTPKLISIGPVHYDNGELPNMKTLKLKYFKDFFSRTCKSQKEFASIIEANEDKIRHCYAEEIPLPERKDFVKMILLDSIFIIELFWRNFERARRSTQKEYMVKDYILRDYILNKPWLACGILQDLRLLENQLPYFILEQLHKKSGFPAKQESFLTLACMYFFGGGGELSIDKNKVKHFTDLYRHFYHAPPGNQGIGEGIEHCATKLDTAGLLFKKWEPQKPEGNSFEGSRDLLKIEFQNPSENLYINWSWPLHCLPCLGKLSCLEHLQTRLEIPQFVVQDETEELFRNLMALEQCHYPTEAYICNYILLLDHLINSKEDVELLVEEGIIVNSLGSTEAVANMVNKFGQEITELTSCYCDVADAVNKHYLSPWNQNMASLKRVYFRDIWRGTATVVGVLVLIMGLLTFLGPSGYRIF